MTVAEKIMDAFDAWRNRRRPQPTRWVTKTEYMRMWREAKRAHTENEGES